MLANKTLDWKPEPLVQSRRYSRASFKKILAARNKDIPWKTKLQLRRKIETAAMFFEFSRANAGQPPPSALAQQMKKIEQSVERVLTELGLPSGSFDPVDLPYSIGQLLRGPARAHAEKLGGFNDLPPTKWGIPRLEDIPGYSGLDYHEDRKLRKIFHELRLLQSWAKTARETCEADVEETKRRGHKRHSGEDALHVFLNELAKAYKTAYGVRPGVSWSPSLRKHGGPFLRYLDACLEPVDAGRRIDAIRELWRRHKDVI